MGAHTASGGSPTREAFHNVEVARAVGVSGGGATSILSSLLSRKGRCIDSTHSKRCTACRDPPPVDSERDWYLRGDPGRRNGDKKLRKLILESNEWGSRKERSLLVKHLQEKEEGLMTAHKNKLIRLLEKQDGSKLCKSSLLHLARLWRFKSTIWVKKKCSRERPPCEKSIGSNPRSHKQTAEGFGLAEQSAETRQTFQAPGLSLYEPLSCTSAIPAIDTSVPSMERILTLLSSSLDTSGKLFEQSEKCINILHASLAWEQVSSTGSPALADMKEMELDQLATDFESTLLGFQAMIGSDSLMDPTMRSVSDSLHALNTLGLHLVLLVKQEAITWRLLRSYETTKYIRSRILALRLFITKFAEKATHLAEKVKGMVQRETVPNQNDLKRLQVVCRTQICKARESIEQQVSTGLGPRSLSASSVPMSPEKKLMRAISNDIILPLYRSISSEVLQFTPVATAPGTLTEEWLDATKVKP